MSKCKSKSLGGTSTAAGLATLMCFPASPYGWGLTGLLCLATTVSACSNGESQSCTITPKTNQTGVTQAPPSIESDVEEFRISPLWENHSTGSPKTIETKQSPKCN